MSKSNKKTKPQNPMAKLALQRLKLVEEEKARLKALQEEEERKIKEEEEKEQLRLKALEEEKARQFKLRQDKKQAQIEAGTYKTKAEKKKDAKLKQKLESLQKNMIINENGRMEMKCEIKSEPQQIITDQEIESNYRSPILCIMGHVDTGKTKLLDNIRNTRVQDDEVGGITQQIGASFIPKKTLLNRTSLLPSDIKIPGLLMIDTPGHEAFSNLRQRGSSLCDVAVVVIDITGGLEQQTVQSINILKESNTKFIFALNKVDRLYGWVTHETDIQNSLLENSISENEFKNRVTNIITEIMCLGLNAKLFWENNSPHDTISICPISAKTGEGISDLLKLIIDISQNELSEEITYNDELKCIVMEKTVNETVGDSIDVILINGTLKKGDIISIQTPHGIINTTIKFLITPPPNRESRVKSEYIYFDSVKGSMGVKIVAHDIDKAIVGTNVFFTTNETNNEANNNTIPDNNIQLQDEGITIFASSQGSLEALAHHLQKECNPPVPISNIFIGSVTKKHLMKMIINKPTKKEFATILAFNVTIEDDVNEYAIKNDIKIFSSEIIYHLFNFYNDYKQQSINERKELHRPNVVFPCVLKILEKHVYNKKNPLIFGVNIVEGNIHIGTPLTTTDTNVYIGKVIGIQLNNNEVTIGKKGSDVCIKVINDQNPNIMYGRHFDNKNILCSAITRNSIDILKTHFRDEATIDDAKLISKIKTILKIN